MSKRDRPSLEAALAELGLSDPRPVLRDRLRDLRSADSAAFESALARFEAEVRDADSLEAWIEYGRYLGDLAGEGRLLSIDATGFATPYEAPVAGSLVLHLPADVAVPPLPVMIPAGPSAAQQATLDLLVDRKLAL